MADDRVQIIFECTTCGNRNYASSKNKKNTTAKLNLKKFCPHCRSHQSHKETK